MPEKLSICLKRGHEESVGNDDVSIVRARKYEMVRRTLRQKIVTALGRFCDIYYHALGKLGSSNCCIFEMKHASGLETCTKISFLFIFNLV